MESRWKAGGKGRLVGRRTAGNRDSVFTGGIPARTGIDNSNIQKNNNRNHRPEHEKINNRNHRLPDREARPTISKQETCTTSSKGGVCVWLFYGGRGISKQANHAWLVCVASPHTGSTYPAARQFLCTADLGTARQRYRAARKGEKEDPAQTEIKHLREEEEM